MEQNLIINKIIETIKSGKPPVDCESINLLTVKTKNFSTNFDKILKKIGSARNGNYEIVTFVGKRGYGKTHLLNYLKCYEAYLENLNKANIGKAPEIVYHPSFLDSDLLLFYQTISIIGKEKIINYLQKNFSGLKNEEIFDHFLKNNLNPTISALFVGLLNKRKDIVNNCFLALTGNYNLSQSPIKLSFINLCKNLEEKDSFSCFKTLTYLITKNENKCLIVEFDEIQEYLKEKEHSVERIKILARRIHKYINEYIPNCVIIFSFTNDAYETLINSEYSDKLGLRNKIEGTKFEFKPLEQEERIDLMHKIFYLFENSIYMKDLNEKIPEDKKNEIKENLENIQPENPREVIKTVVYELMKFWEDTYLIKKTLNEMTEEGKRIYIKYEKSHKLLGDILHKSLFILFDSLPEFKPVEREVEIKGICDDFVKKYFSDLKKYEKSLDLLLSFRDYKIGVSIGYSVKKDAALPISKLIPIAAYAHNDLTKNRGLLIVYGYSKFGIKNGAYRVFTKINELKTAINVICLDDEWFKRVLSFNGNLEDVFSSAKIFYKFYNLPYLIEDLINMKTPIYQIFKE